MYLSVTYKIKWRLKDNPNYYWTECKKLVNVRRGREVKRTLHGLTPGYWIGRKFISLDTLKTQIELIPKNNLPF